MGHDEFHNLVLRVANQTYIRYWNYFNHPYLPQQFAIRFTQPPHDDLAEQLIGLGFERWEHEQELMFVINKTAQPDNQQLEAP